MSYNALIHSEGSDEKVYEAGAILTLKQGAKIKMPLTFATGAAVAAYSAAFFATPFACKVIGFTEKHGVKGTDVGAVTLDLKQNTDTAGSAATVLSAPLSLKTANDTLQSATVAANTLAAGDKLFLVVTGTPTAVADVEVEVLVQII